MITRDALSSQRRQIGVRIMLDEALAYSGLNKRKLITPDRRNTPVKSGHMTIRQVLQRQLASLLSLRYGRLHQ